MCCTFAAVGNHVKVAVTTACWGALTPASRSCSALSVAHSGLQLHSLSINTSGIVAGGCGCRTTGRRTWPTAAYMCGIPHTLIRSAGRPACTLDCPASRQVHKFRPRCASAVGRCMTAVAMGACPSRYCWSHSLPVAADCLVPRLRRFVP